MEKDNQGNREQGFLRRQLEKIGLYNKFELNDLLQSQQCINAGDWDAEVHYDGTKIVRITNKIDGKTLYVTHRLPNLGVRKEEEQIIKAVIIPTGGSYTISFDNKKTGPIAWNAPTINIQKALDDVGLKDLRATGSMDTQIDIKCTGSYAFMHQDPVIVDSSSLTIGAAPGTPLTIPPTVKRIIPTDNYLIAQQQGGEKFSVLLKEDKGTNKREPVATMPYYFFSQNIRMLNEVGGEGGVEVQLTNVSTPKRIDTIRQGRQK